MQEIKQAAAAVAKKRKELDNAMSELAEAKAIGRLPRSAQTSTHKTPVFQNDSADGPVRIIQGQNLDGGAQTYVLEERVEKPAEDDVLLSLQRQRKAEIGRAHLEKRSPDISDLDLEIAEIEGARAAIEILEQRVDVIKEELIQVQKALGSACMVFAHDRWNAAYLEYENALDAMIEALAKMSSTDSLAYQAAELTGRRISARTTQFLERPRRILKNGNSYPVNFINAVQPEAHNQALERLNVELEQLGVLEF